MSLNIAKIEERACKTKKAHGTKREALDHLRRVPKKQGRRAKVYLCPFAPDHSPHYHVGHDFSGREGRLNLNYSSLLSPSRS